MSLMLGCAVLVSGCGQQANAASRKVQHSSPPWTLQWISTNPARASLPAAFAASAYAVDPAGGRNVPHGVTWLITAPTFGLSLLQLDPASQSVALAYFTHPGNWQLETAVTVVRPQPRSGYSGPGLIPFPRDYYASASSVKVAAPSSVTQLWLSPQRTFAFAFVPDAFGAPPTDAQTVVIEGHDGWLIHEAQLATIVVPMVDRTLVFSGTAEDQEMEALASKCIDKLPQLARSAVPS